MTTPKSTSDRTIYQTGLELTGTRILVLPPKRETKSAGGIVLVQDTVQREERAATTGVLIAASADAMKCREMQGIEIGDTVFFARYAGDNVPFTKDGREYKVLNAPDIIGKLTEAPDDPFRPAATARDLGMVHEQV